MDDDIDLVAALCAYQAGRAMRVASHKRISVRSDALVLCPIGMAGEDTTIHTLAVGAIGTPALVLTAPDPRVRDDQYRLFDSLLDVIGTYFDKCRANGEFPQLWVQSNAAVTLLDTLAERLRFSVSDPTPQLVAEVSPYHKARRLGELLTYSAERAPIAGQQAMFAATSALRMHWRTGQPSSADEHLGALLAWVEGAEDIHSAVAHAEKTPMGVRTDPEFDRTFLEPLIGAYGRARRGSAGPAILANLSTSINDALEPVVLRVYQATQRAVALLRDQSWPTLPDLGNFEDLERLAFLSFMQDRDQGRRLPVRDTPPVAVYKFEHREHAVQTHEAALQLGDCLARAQGRATGHVVAAEVLAIRNAGSGAWEIDFWTSQQRLRARRRDILRWTDNLDLSFSVVDVQRIDGATRIQTEIRVRRGGERKFPALGARIDLIEHVPDWDGFDRAEQKVRRRIHPTPWSHDPNAVVPEFQPIACPQDPLELVEGLKC